MFSVRQSAGIFALAVLSVQSSAAIADTPEQMMAHCRERAHNTLRYRLPDIETKYEGQRTDGTHAVNGTARANGRVQTFQCSFGKGGNKIIQFVVNEPAGDDGGRPANASGDAKVPNTQFNATGNIPCARAADQPMAQCQFGVVRKGNGNGSITVFWPDGGNRVIFFEDATPAYYDESQADAGAKMTTGKNGDLFTVKIGTQRFEIPEAVISGG